MSLSYYIDKKSVYLVLRKQIKGKKLNIKYYPGIIVPDGVKLVKNRTGITEIDKKLSKIEFTALEVIEKISIESLNSKIFSSLVDRKIKNKGDLVNDTNLYTYFEVYYEKILSEKGYEIAKHINKSKNKLKDFNDGLTFADINMKFYFSFVSWLEKKGYSLNYIGAILRNFKSVLKYATDCEENTNLTYQKFPNIAEEVYNVYLSEAEIEKINKLKITPSMVEDYHKKLEAETGVKKTHLSNDNYKKQADGLNLAKDLFIIGCWTGLRVGNYLNIDDDIHIDYTSGFIHAIANKNGPKLKIPIHKLVREILQKNNGLPGQISEQKLNKHLKVIGRLAEINETIIYTRTIGGKRKEFAKPKHKLITSHTARRAFASNMEIRGIPRQYTMAITGHKSEKSYKKYIQAVQQDILTEKMKQFDVWG